MIRRLTKVKKDLRRERNYRAVKAIYDRAATTFPADYLTCYQEADSITKNRVLDSAETRRQLRNAKRIRNWNGLEAANGNQ